MDERRRIGRPYRVRHGELCWVTRQRFMCAAKGNRRLSLGFGDQFVELPVDVLKRFDQIVQGTIELCLIQPLSVSLRRSAQSLNFFRSLVSAFHRVCTYFAGEKKASTAFAIACGLLPSIGTI